MSEYTITHEQAPDVQFGDEGLTAASLPTGSVLQGMTDNVHPDQSLADLHQGFSTINERGNGVPGWIAQDTERDTQAYPDGATGSGFAGRPMGWER